MWGNFIPEIYGVAKALMVAQDSDDAAVDALWTMLLVPNWENLTGECGWTRDQYIERMTMMASGMFVA